MTPDEDYAVETIRKWVKSGFYSPTDVRDMLDDILSGGEDPATLENAIDESFAAKRAEEADWPAMTDCDRLDRVFYKLHEQGICALDNAGYTMSDGFSDVSEAVAQAPAGHYHGFCFYHGQDVERAIDGGGLMIAFGDLNDDDTAGVAVGRIIVGALHTEGLETRWPETMDTRIDVPNIDWRRRGPPNLSPSDFATRAPSTEAASSAPWWQFWRR